MRVGVSSSFALGLGSSPSLAMPARRTGPQPAPPDSNFPRTTRFHLESGSPQARIEDKLQLPQESSVVSSFAFLDWQIDDGPPAIASAPRSKVVAALLQGTRRPTLLEHSRLEDVVYFF